MDESLNYEIADGLDLKWLTVGCLEDAKKYYFDKCPFFPDEVNEHLAEVSFNRLMEYRIKNKQPRLDSKESKAGWVSNPDLSHAPSVYNCCQNGDKASKKAGKKKKHKNKKRK